MTHLDGAAPFFAVALLLSPLTARWLRGAAGLALTAAVAAVLSFLPLCGGIGLAGLILSVVPLFSVPTALLLAAGLARYWLSSEWLTRSDLVPLFIVNAVFGTVLYVSALGQTSWQIYDLGYRFSVLFVLWAAATVLLAVLGSRSAVLLLAAAAAWLAGLLPSPNLSDYVIDLPLYLYSLGMLASLHREASGSLLRETPVRPGLRLE